MKPKVLPISQKPQKPKLESNIFTYYNINNSK